MRLVIQRVTRASVTVDQEIVGKIKKGFLVFVGIGASDYEAKADYIRSEVEALCAKYPIYE